MSHYDYMRSRELAKHDVPFCALLYAAMRKADTANTFKLAMMWPELWRDAYIRYNVPGQVTSREEHEREHADATYELEEEQESFLRYVDKCSKEQRIKAEDRWNEIASMKEKSHAR